MAYRFDPWQNLKAIHFYRELIMVSWTPVLKSEADSSIEPCGPPYDNPPSDERGSVWTTLVQYGYGTSSDFRLTPNSSDKQRVVTIYDQLGNALRTEDLPNINMPQGQSVTVTPKTLAQIPDSQWVHIDGEGAEPYDWQTPFSNLWSSSLSRQYRTGGQQMTPVGVCVGEPTGPPGNGVVNYPVDAGFDPFDFDTYNWAPSASFDLSAISVSYNNKSYTARATATQQKGGPSNVHTIAVLLDYI